MPLNKLYRFCNHLHYRPRSSAGRPLSGVVRPGTHAREGTMEQTLRTSRTARTARATSSSAARFVRLGTVTVVYALNK